MADETKDPLRTAREALREYEQALGNADACPPDNECYAECHAGPGMALAALRAALSAPAPESQMIGGQDISVWFRMCLEAECARDEALEEVRALRASVSGAEAATAEAAREDTIAFLGLLSRATDAGYWALHGHLECAPKKAEALHSEARRLLCLARDAVHRNLRAYGEQPPTPPAAPGVSAGGEGGEEGYCVCGHAAMAHYAGGCLIVGGMHGGCDCGKFRVVSGAPRSEEGKD